jgi:endonuclease YncB( thermonuclease family)
MRRFLDLLLAVVILSLIALVVARMDRIETRQPTGSAVVNDGDTITIGGERIRLRGIDAPEFNQTCKVKGEPYPCGRKAREALRALIGGRAVDCEGWERDRYGRLLAICTVGTTDINRALVDQGWAVAFGDFEAEEAAARRSARGLWAGEFDRPRQWRDTHGSLAETDHDAPAKVYNWLRQIFHFG